MKWFAAVLYRDGALLEEVLARLAHALSAIDYHGPSYPFAETHYYAAEMGAGLNRVLIGFAGSGEAERLVAIKHLATAIEQEFAENGARRVNIDPGYVDLFKVVLASGKARGNKLYMGQGVWSDIALYYQGGTFHPLPWSFPDFKSGRYTADLLALRRLYKQALARRP
ncbi:MAG: DUF4416 family protein [Gammaproteobacteria bacterium]